jgi:hypothetical protein
VQRFADVEAQLHDLCLPDGAADRMKALLGEMRGQLHAAAGPTAACPA